MSRSYLQRRISIVIKNLQEYSQKSTSSEINSLQNSDGDNSNHSNVERSLKIEITVFNQAVN